MVKTSNSTNKTKRKIFVWSFRIVRRVFVGRFRHKIVFSHNSSNENRYRLFTTLKRFNSNDRCGNQTTSSLTKREEKWNRIEFSGFNERAGSFSTSDVNRNDRRCFRKYAIADRFAESNGRQVKITIFLQRLFSVVFEQNFNENFRAVRNDFDKKTSIDASPSENSSFHRSFSIFSSTF